MADPCGQDVRRLVCEATCGPPLRVPAAAALGEAPFLAQAEHALKARNVSSLFQRNDHLEQRC